MVMIDHSLNYGRPLLAKLLQRIKPKKVLDIGAGKGDDLFICRKHCPKAELYAVEENLKNIKLLEKKGIGVSSLNLEKHKFPHKSGTFDLIIANQILEHCKELFWIFHEISRTLKIGGHVYVGVPNLASLHSRLLLLLGRQPTCIRNDGPHVRGFTKPDFLNFLKHCAKGLYSVESVKGANFYPFPPITASLLAKLFPTGSACLFFVLKKLRTYENEFIKFPVDLETNFFIGDNLDHK